jgi:hypothetical protein
MMTRIEPTIGRVVWFWPRTYMATDSGNMSVNQPYTAQVCFLYKNGHINVAGYKHDGSPFTALDVTLRQDGDEMPQGPYAEWMPYQKGQAAKTEALEKQVSTHAQQDA